MEGHLNTSKILLSASMSIVNEISKQGMTALMLASKFGHYRLVELLVKCGANVDVISPQRNSTALILATQEGHIDCVDVLVSMGAEIYLRNDEGHTAIDIAVRNGHLGLVPLFNTQTQVQRVQCRLHEKTQRSLLTMRDAALQNKLTLQCDNISPFNLMATGKRQVHWSVLLYR
jgi:ankyrin repeat protein